MKKLKKHYDIPPTPFKGGVFSWLLLGIVVFLLQLSSCINAQQKNNQNQFEEPVTELIVGAEQTELYFPLLKDKSIAIVANQTSVINNVHLVDSLINAGFNVKRVFGPEHGFRGKAADGEHVKDDMDTKTGVTVISLYGAHKKPSDKDLEDIDVVIFDIQDVGARFYTYISTMSFVMESCAENNIEFIVLDRPNPHGDYVDGPVLEKEFSSFVGLHPVPVVHGMTVGEYAKMVNGEDWLKNSIKCKLTVIPCKNYDHKIIYELPIPPSPNLPNNIAIQLYPSLCFFEGTIISVGRGTEFPFQIIGHPDFVIGSFVFTPEPITGVSSNPKHKGKTCYGQSLQGLAEQLLQRERKLNLGKLLGYYDFFKERDVFFTPYFEKLAGTDRLRKQIEEGLTEEQIRASWQEDLEAFKKIRKKYLLYNDFE